MIKQIEFKDLNRAGQEAVSLAHERVVAIFKMWGFECGGTPFTDPPDNGAGVEFNQALVNFLVAANQPEKVPNERP